MSSSADETPDFESIETTGEIDPKTADEKHLNGYITRFIRIQGAEKARDDVLWEDYVQDFEEWENETFLKANKFARRRLQNFLRANGVYVPRGPRFQINRELTNILRLEQWHEWTDEEIQEQINKFGGINSRQTEPPKIFIRPTTQQPTTTTTPQPLQTIPEGAQGPTERPTVSFETPEQNTRNVGEVNFPGLPTYQPPTTEQAEYPPQPPSNPSNRSDTQRPTSETPQGPSLRRSDMPASSFNQNYGQEQFSGRPEEFRATNTSDNPNISLYSREIATLMKVYGNDMKYSGTEDVLDSKLRIFKDFCQKCSLPPPTYKMVFSTMLKGSALDYYYNKLSENMSYYTFEGLVNALRVHFETEERRHQTLAKWNTASLPATMQKNPDKTMQECFELLVIDLQQWQLRLAPDYHNDLTIRDQLIQACQEVGPCKFACYKPSPTFESMCADLRSSIGTSLRGRRQDNAASYNTEENSSENEYDNTTYYTDRKYFGRQRFNRSNTRSNSRSSGYGNRTRPKTCFVCKKTGCWSSNHTLEERRRSVDALKRRLTASKTYFNDEDIQDAVDAEGFDPEENQDDRSQEHLIMNETKHLDDDDSENRNSARAETPASSTYFTSVGELEGYRAVALLNDNTVRHVITKSSPNDIWFSQRYSSMHFQGIIVDSGAANKSTAGYSQFQALKKIQDVRLDKSDDNKVDIKFGIGTSQSIGAIDVNTPVGLIKFYVLETDTPFLFCLQDMDKFRVYYNNLKDLLVNEDTGLTVPVIRKFGHAFMMLGHLEETVAFSYESEIELNECHLTEQELRQLHRRFGHPSAHRFIRVLERSGHDFDKDFVEELTKYCHVCQENGKAPQRFKFTLRDDREFNYCIYVDIFHIHGRPVLHVVDETTRFQAARWVKSFSAEDAWDALRACWIDVYIGPPDIITHDAGTNFSSTRFQQSAASMGTTTREVPVEAHNTIGQVERYHIPLRRAYEVVTAEMKDLSVDKETMLQMAVKAVNDTAGPDGIVPTLLVFGAYPRMTRYEPPAPGIIERAVAIKAAMKEVREAYAERQVTDALRMRNGPRTNHLKNLPVNSQVLVWREKKKWTGPWTLLDIKGESCKVDLPSGPTFFRSTVVKPYYTMDDKKNSENSENPENQSDDHDEEDAHGDDVPENQSEQPEQPIRRPRGRPIGSRNMPRDQVDENQENLRRSMRNRATNETMQTLINDKPFATTYITAKEASDLELSKKLRSQGIIKTPGAPFEASRKQEIDGLIAKGVFELIPYNDKTMGHLRLFNSRLVDEIKGKTTSPYEKSRLVIQAYNDEGKVEILTQSPTIQRVSQRLILALAPSLDDCQLYLRDISQAYVQSTTRLNRTILAKPPKEIAASIPPNTVMRIIKPLYGIPEAGTHWFGTYNKHHRQNLGMVPSTYDPCLLITTTPKIFGIVGMQTDDTLFLGNKAFAALENSELEKAKLAAKPHEALTPEKPIIFNGGKIIQEQRHISFIQKDQANKIALINAKSSNYKDAYLEQRARGAYIATICQPEAAFDLSVAAQHQEPTEADVQVLNKRLDWQMRNKSRGMRFIPLDLTTAKLFVFVDGSFANNQDYSSQIGYIIALANESTTSEQFKINGNIFHWSSVKCKRVTRSVLASELYSMVQGIDIAIAINTTLNMITKQLGLDDIPTIICTDSFSLYECMVKLGTTKEKRLMIDIMAIRESYERRELSEIRWINGDNNPADAMTKANPTKALKSFIETNSLDVRVEGWVQRELALQGI